MILLTIKRASHMPSGLFVSAALFPALILKRWGFVADGTVAGLPTEHSALMAAPIAQRQAARERRFSPGEPRGAGAIERDSD